MIYDWNFAERAVCAEKEKYELVDLIGTILDMASESRREGLFSMERHLKNKSKPFLFKLGIKLMLEGADATMLRSILETHILTGNYRGLELIKRIIILEGLFLIRDCVSPSLIGERLYSFLGENYHKLLDSKKLDDLEDFLDTISTRGPIDAETAQLEGIFEVVSGKKISRILNELNTEKLAIALEGSGGKVINEIFDNIDKEKAVMLHQLLRSNAASNIEVIAATQEEIRDLILNRIKEKRIFKF